MADDHARALVIFSDVLAVAHEKWLADLALEKRLPAVFGFREFADMGDSSPTVRAHPRCGDKLRRTWTRS